MRPSNRRPTVRPSPAAALRRIAARHRLLRVMVIVALAATAGAITNARSRAVDEARRSWGEGVTVWVAARTLVPGDALETDAVRSRQVPRALVPPAAVRERPGGTARHGVGPGEIIVTSDLATGSDAPAGWAVVTLSLRAMPPAVPGERVMIASAGTELAEGVVTSPLDAAEPTPLLTVAVPPGSVAAVLAADEAGAVSVAVLTP